MQGSSAPPHWCSARWCKSEVNEVATQMPQIGDKAPSFEALDQDGNRVTLADFKGKWLVLAFFVKAKTPG